MAAAEYFNPNASMASGSHPAPGPAPSAGPQYPPQPAGGLPRPNAPPQQQNLVPPYPVSDAPPPYSEQQRPHSQPPPGQRPTVHFNPSEYQPYRPNQPNQPNADTHQYPPDKMPQPQGQRPAPQNMYRPSDFQPAQPPPFQGQPNAYPTPVAPGLSQVYPNGPQQRPSSAGQSPYRRSSRSRSRSRERRKRHQHKTKTEPTRSKDTGMNTFLGAGGGAIIGDLIFPGLGTLGGAIIGGVGGHEYTKNKTHRSSSNPSRTYRRSYSNSADYYADEYRRGRS